MIYYLKRHINMSDIFQSRNTNWNGGVEESCKGRQSNQFLLFCDLILKYEKYKLPEDELNDSLYSPSGSEGTNDSFSTESNSSFHSNNSLSNEDIKSDMTADEEVGVHATVSQSFGEDDSSWDLITCPCMKPFAGRPMIECSVCQNWLHMSCAKVRKNNIPDDFTCQLCRETKSSKRRSERIRSDDRGYAVLR